MSRNTLYVVIIITMILGLAFSQPGYCQLCTGDVNGNSIPLEPADLAYLMNYVNSGGPAPIPLYQGDLSGDCVIDQSDIEVLQCFFTYGWSCFPTYPVPPWYCQETDIGACCDTLGNCFRRSFQNCMRTGGYFLNHGTWCDPPPAECELTCVHPPSGMVAWYPLEQNVGSCPDIAGQHNGQILGNPGVSPGAVGNALSFNWTNQAVVRIKDDPFLEIGEGDFTIDAWIYPEAPPTNCGDRWICGDLPIVDNSNRGYG